jgi:hypothetical protein
MRFLDRIFQRRIQEGVHAALAACTETDATFTVGSRLGEAPFDRYAPDREEVQRQALEAWRINPLARRIVGLTSQYVVGGGINFSCPHAPTIAFLNIFWRHPLNRMAVRVYEWCDELTRSGNLFLLLSTDASGMSYLRAVPSAQVRRINSRANDLDQELSYEMQPNLSADGDAEVWQAYDASRDAASGGGFPTVMLHYAVNRPVGAQWGESDLSPVLRWLSRYAA